MNTQPTKKCPTDLCAESRVFTQDLYKSYGPKLVLDNVDLAIPPGELVSVVGPSGCGKSTLLRLILGQELPDKGILNVSNRNVGFPDITRGFVAQKYTLYPHLTVLQNVTLGLELSAPFWKQLDPRFRKMNREKAMEYLTQMSLDQSAQNYPHELSGGMSQRVAIAQALILQPQILLMDEPFGALDPGTRERLQVFLLGLWEKYKMTIFFVTHDLEEAVYLGTRVIALSQYYTDDRGDKCIRGAKIKVDLPLTPEAMSTKVKSEKSFRDKVEFLKDEAFNPNHRKHVRDFNLDHPFSFQTLAPGEDIK